MDKEEAIIPKYDIIQCVLSNGQTIIGQSTDTDEHGDPCLSLKNIYCVFNLGDQHSVRDDDVNYNMFELPIGDFVTLYHYIPGMEIGKIYGIDKRHIISQFIASEEMIMIYSEVLVRDHMDILQHKYDLIEKMEKERQEELNFSKAQVAMNLKPRVEDEIDSGNDNIIKFSPNVH
jgi:hypothetical protein